MDRNPRPDLAATSLGEEAAIGRIEKALFGGDDRLVTVGRYEVRELIGSGAFGKVYRARDPELARDVALKILTADGITADDADRAELLREARAMAALGHPNVVAVHDAGVVDHAGRVRVYIAMELVAGASLRVWLSRPRTSGEIVDVLRQVGRGLAAAHAAKLVHRDLKPDNILVGDDGRVRVVDFGLARSHGSRSLAPRDGAPTLDTIDPALTPTELAPMDRATTTGAIVGTPAYMAPEQLGGAPATPLADQFAFCVTAWEALSGERPFAGSSVRELRDAILLRPIASPRTPIPGRIARVLARGLAGDPRARFGSMDELVAALERRARWLLPAALAATAVIGIAVGAVAMASRDGDERAAVDPCPVPTEELAGIWDAPRRTQIEHAFAATKLAFARDAFARAATGLDRVAAAWLDANREACLATAVRREQSSAQLDRRVACLRDWRRQLAAVTDALAAPTAMVVQRAVQSVAELPPLAHCADRDALAPLPTDPAARKHIDELYDKLARARELQLTGQAEANALADEVTRDPATAKYPPLAIAAAQWHADAYTVVGRYDDARLAAHYAFDTAIGIGDKRAAALAAASIAALGAFDTTRKPEALQWVNTGKSLVAKLDDALELDARLAQAEGNVYMTNADATNAEAALVRAVADWKRIDPDHPSLGASLAMLGISELAHGRVDAAEMHLRDALARIEAAFGPDHPDAARAAINVALVDAARGHYKDAAVSTDRAIALLKTLYGADHPMLLYAYGSHAQHAVARGDLALADRDYVEAARIATVSLDRGHPMNVQIALGRADALARAGRGKEALAVAGAARSSLAAITRDDDLGLAFADATLAHALAAAGDRQQALERARDAARRCRAVPDVPSGPCAIAYQALGDVARDPAEAETAYADAERAITTGTPDPLRLAETRFALARLRYAHDHAAGLELARTAYAEFPRDGDPALLGKLARWRLDAAP